ncbi:MAG TPA: hypothetical protein VLC46_26730 [Thermoanaerobaculia bacterium]|jgi:hypothetical protein|nr:hypothetical protein [Thermoanaerobaculia bacterium]
MDKVRPFTGTGATAAQINAYHRKYRAKKRGEIRVYNRLWMRAFRRKKRQEALKTGPKRAA